MVHAVEGSSILSQTTKRDFLYVATAAFAGGAVVGVGWPLIDQMNPAADALALASIDVDYTKVALGQQIVYQMAG